MKKFNKYKMIYNLNNNNNKNKNYLIKIKIQIQIIQKIMKR